MAILNEDMVDLRKLCEEHQREMPTQIKLIYDVAANSLNVDYSYDIIYSNHKIRWQMTFWRNGLSLKK